jgi:hypothetical protein
MNAFLFDRDNNVRKTLILPRIERPTVSTAKTKATKKPKTHEYILLLQGSKESKQWYDDFADHVGIPKANVVDVAMSEYAAKRGFRAMPRRGVS